MTAHLQRTVRTPDGRTLAVEEAGDPDGRPVFVHMGSPNSRHLYEPNGADAAVLKDDLAEYLLYTGREGLAPGGEGWWEDSVAFARPWGFELPDITVPVLVMQGGRISSCRSATASGWPLTCPARRPGCSRTTVTSPWR